MSSTLFGLTYREVGPFSGPPGLLYFVWVIAADFDEAVGCVKARSGDLFGGSWSVTFTDFTKVQESPINGPVRVGSPMQIEEWDE